MSNKVKIFNITGAQIDELEFPTYDEAHGFCVRYGQTNSGFAQMDEPQDAAQIAQATDRLNIAIDQAIKNQSLSATPEVTPQDLGKPSPVPYSIFIQRPSPDIDPKGQKIFRLNLAVAYRTDAIGLLPLEIEHYIDIAFQAFEAGHYRFELVVGDWSIKVYKHPNNP